MTLLAVLKKNTSRDKRRLKKLVSGLSFDYFIMALILFNAVVLGLLTSESLAVYSNILFLLDRVCLAIFVAEIVMKIFAFGKDFFKSGWNVFDFIVIALSAVSLSSYFIVLRTFRLFLLLRYIDRFARLKQMLSIFVGLIPSFGAMLLIYTVFFYVFAIVAVSLYGASFQEFSSLGRAMFSLLQVFTLDGWADGVVRPVMTVYPSAWAFFVGFLFVSFLMVLSFVISAVAEVIRKSMGIFPKIKF